MERDSSEKPPSIRRLSKKKYSTYRIHFEYETRQYYDVLVSEESGRVAFELVLKDFDEPQKRWFDDTLYQPYNPHAIAYGILDNHRLVAALEVKPEPWGNRLRVVNLWVAEDYRRNRYGSALMQYAKDLAKQAQCRALVLETQSCDVPAIEFYQKHGFSFIGIDTTCYTDYDIQSQDVSLEMGCHIEAHSI